MYKLFKNTKLVYIVAITLLIGMFVPVFFTGYVVIKAQKNILENDLHKFHENSANLLAAAIRTPLWELRQDMASEIIEPLMRDERIVSVLVYDKGRKNIFLEFKDANKAKGNLYELKKPILNDSDQIGELSVTVSDYMMQNELSSMISISALIFGIEFLFGLLLMLPQLYIKILRPLNRLSVQATKFSKNELDEPFLWEQNDEVGIVGKSFEVARTEISALIDNQKKHNEVLEFALKEAQSAKEEALVRESERNEAIRRKEEALSELLTNIAHHWRQPLNVISLQAQNIEELLSDGVDTKNIVPGLHKISKEALSLSETITKMTRFYKQQSDGVTTHSELETLFKSLIQELSNDPEFKIIVHYDIFNTTLPISTTTIRYIIKELIQNSIDVAKSRNKQKLEIKVSLTEEESVNKISITDDAGGIQDEQINHIFEPYYTTAFKTRNKGLGLYIIKNIVEKSLDGKIHARNTESGVEFVINIRQK